MGTLNEDENQHTDEGAPTAVEGDPNVWVEDPPFVKGAPQHYRNLGVHWGNAEVAGETVHPNYNLIEGAPKVTSNYAPGGVGAAQD